MFKVTSETTTINFSILGDFCNFNFFILNHITRLTHMFFGKIFALNIDPI